MTGGNFDEIVAGLDLSEDVTDVRDVSTLSNGELMLEFSRVKRELIAAGDMLSNRPGERTADLLSLRGALSIEMRRRQLT